MSIPHGCPWPICLWLRDSPIILFAIHRGTYLCGKCYITKLFLVKGIIDWERGISKQKVVLNTSPFRKKSLCLRDYVFLYLVKPRFGCPSITIMLPIHNPRELPERSHQRGSQARESPRWLREDRRLITSSSKRGVVRTMFRRKKP